MTIRPLIAATAALTSIVLFAPAASAMGISGGGGRIGYLDPQFADGGLALGAHLELESPGSNWHVQPNILWWDADPLTGFNNTLDAFYPCHAQSRTSPYLGAGLGLDMIDVPGNDSETDLGVNLFGGVLFPAGSNNLFIEARHTLSDVDQSSVSFGITLR